MEESRQKFNILMMRIGIREEPRKTIASFKSGLTQRLGIELSYYPIVI